MLRQEDKEIGTYNTNTNNLPGMVTWQHIEENKDQGEKVSSEEGRRLLVTKEYSEECELPWASGTERG